jgi:hypothetical protein
VLLAACGGSSGGGAALPKDPKGELVGSFSNLGSSDALTVTLKLQTTASALQGYAAQGGDKITPAEAQDLASAQVVIETKTDNGSNLDDSAKSAKHVQFRLTLQDNGTSYGDIRVRDNALYVQADLKGLLAVAGKSNIYGNLQAESAQLPDFVKALVAGKWVSLNLDSAKTLLNQVGGGAATAPSSSQQSKLVTDLKAALSKDVAVTKLGSDSDGDHLRLTGNLHTLATDLTATLGTDLPAASTVLGQVKKTNVPSRDVTIDAWVKDNALSKLSLDLTQFAGKGDVKAGQSLPVVLTFDRNGDTIDKPSDVTPVDLTKLFSLFSALGGK